MMRSIQFYRIILPCVCHKNPVLFASFRTKFTPILCWPDTGIQGTFLGDIVVVRLSILLFHSGSFDKES